MPPAHLDGGPGRPRRGSREGSPGPPVAPVRAPSHDEAPGLCPLLTADPVGGASTWLSCPVPTTPSRHLGHQATPCCVPGPLQALASLLLPPLPPPPLPPAPKAPARSAQLSTAGGDRDWDPLSAQRAAPPRTQGGTPAHVCVHTCVLSPTRTRQMLRQPSRISTGRTRATAAPTCPHLPPPAPGGPEPSGLGGAGHGRTGVDGPLVGGTEDGGPLPPGSDF